MNASLKSSSALFAATLAGALSVTSIAGASEAAPGADQPVAVQTQPIDAQSTPLQGDPLAPAAPSETSTMPLERKGVDASPSTLPGASDPAANATVSAEALEGQTVVSLNGETVGKVREVHTDENGRVSSITAEFGGVLGFGAKTIDVPAGAMKIKPDLIVIAMTGDEIKARLN
ncbi:PRC-barrel domain protein [Roseibium hamelinense]|uniref:PRC-barrel domain protein n=1 Tax=Roseibium hamelinense TaxID=150831 RepID=A0A562T9J9_9HYPH|nr:PRC-barrel domain-containing protein [Roseibium hamelinense]MTI42805.1 PRC-barrel domain containing protein [Roseibium hamelinense]TWI89470.1 PRC-barrel domain protein [Roseibium hamelinense]